MFLLDEGALFRIRITEKHERALLLQNRYLFVPREHSILEMEEVKGTVIYYTWSFEARVLTHYLEGTTKKEAANVARFFWNSGDENNIMFHTTNRIKGYVDELQELLDECNGRMQVAEYPTVDSLIEDVRSEISDYSELDVNYFKNIRQCWGQIAKLIGKLNYLERSFLRKAG